MYFSKKIIMILLVSLMLIAVVLSGCTSTDSTVEQDVDNNNVAQKYSMKIMHSYTVTGQFGKNVEKFKELVENYTDGRVEVTIFPNAQLGSTDKEAAMVVSGQAEATFTISDMMVIMDPAEAIYNIPFLIASNPGDGRLLRSVIESEKVEGVLRKRQKEMGLYRLGNIPNMFGTFVMANNVRPVNTIDDAKGLKIRIPGGEYPATVLKAFGASPIQMSSQEVPVALSQGAIDGLLSSVNYYHESRWHTKYLTLPYIWSCGIPVLVNLNWWNGLPEDIQDIIENKVMPELLDYAFKEVSEIETAYVEEMQKEPYNVQISYMDYNEESMKKLIEEVQEQAIDSFIKKTGEDGKIMVEEVIKLREQIK